MNAIVFACSVCGTVTPAQQSAYLGTTAFLSFLPLIFIALMVGWVIREVNNSANQTVGGQNQGGSGSQQGAGGHSSSGLPFGQNHGASHGAHRDAGGEDGDQSAVISNPSHFVPGIRPANEEPCPS